MSALKENKWCPDVCPITKRPFFMWLEHPEHGCVPTYGGPYDSYTLAELDDDGTFFCERYDHDEGGWLIDQTESIGLRLIDDQREDYEYGTLESLRAQLASAQAEKAELVKQAAKVCDDMGDEANTKYGLTKSAYYEGAADHLDIASQAILALIKDNQEVNK